MRGPDQLYRGGDGLYGERQSGYRAASPSFLRTLANSSLIRVGAAADCGVELLACWATRLLVMAPTASLFFACCCLTLEAFS